MKKLNFSVNLVQVIFFILAHVHERRNLANAHSGNMEVTLCLRTCIGLAGMINEAFHDISNAGCAMYAFNLKKKAIRKKTTYPHTLL
jgi:hypothetical protein